MKLTNQLLTMSAVVISLSMSAELIWDELPAPINFKGYSIKKVAIANKDVIWALGMQGENSALFSWDAPNKTWKDHPKNMERIITIAASPDNILFIAQKNPTNVSIQGWNGSVWREVYSIEHATTVNSISAINKNLIYVIVNEKAYALNIETKNWQQLSSLEGFREISASKDGAIYARRFDFQLALNPDTAFPAYSLQLLAWTGSSWQQKEFTIDKEKSVASIAVQDKNNVWCIIREEASGGKAYKWLDGQQKLELLGNRTDLYTIAASADGTVWAFTWAPNDIDRKLYSWGEKREEKPAEAKKIAQPMPQPAPASQMQPKPALSTGQIASAAGQVQAPTSQLPVAGQVQKPQAQQQAGQTQTPLAAQPAAAGSQTSQQQPSAQQKQVSMQQQAQQAGQATTQPAATGSQPTQQGQQPTATQGQQQAPSAGQGQQQQPSGQ